MLVNEAIYIRLADDADVSALAVGGIWAGFLKQTTSYPAVAYRKVSYAPVLRLESRGHAGLASFRFRFFSTANLAAGGYDAAAALDEAIRISLHGFKDTVTNDESPPETFNILGIFPESSFDMYDDPSQTYQVITDFEIWGQQVQPEVDDSAHLFENGEVHEFE